MGREPFTYPFCYTPSPEVAAAAAGLIARLDTLGAGGARETAELRAGKMLGVLLTDRGPRFAFSGLVAGKATLDGFVPPIFDLSGPDGYYRRREAEISAMPPGAEKSAASAALQEWIFRQYVVRNGKGEEKSILDIFAERGLTPPGGTGDCAAPKLLHDAFRNGLQPLAMGEFWYGASSHREVREQGRFYPACTGKCGPLLTWMMQGLDVAPSPLDACFPLDGEPRLLYEDADILVVDKPAGMLSVPGRTAAPSLLGWLQERYGEVHSCHRLDMDTAGVMVYARHLSAKAALERQFAERQVEKDYLARLVGGPWNHARKGTIALPLAGDYYDRPRQLVDREHGRHAVTRYEVLDILPDASIQVRFTPLTGRSHQIRVHAAHPDGLGHPVKGDRLYGSADGGRLWLRAERLTFSHPVTGERLTFRSEA
ncbi:MAG: RluA family pseudouridine synthase [Bacteroidales bacterium]|nr:RluA family pseudouridine synthase [Bacteroidales bacterium]